MSNRLSMATHQSIETLHRSGHSNREIARLLSIDRGAVNKRVRQIRAESQSQKESDSAASQIQNRPNAPTGSEADLGAESVQNRPNAPTGSEAPEPSSNDVESAGLSGPKSQCSEYREHIEKKLAEGLSAVRIHQDLKIDYGFDGSYYSVRRFIRSLSEKTPLPFRRMETEPGQEAQSVQWGAISARRRSSSARMGRNVVRGCFVLCSVVLGKRTAKLSGDKRRTTSSRPLKIRFTILAACRRRWSASSRAR